MQRVWSFQFLDFYLEKDAKFSITYHVPVDYGLIGTVARQLVANFIGTKSEVK